MEKVVPIYTLAKWMPVFWILGICIGFFVLLMLIEWMRTKKK